MITFYLTLEHPVAPGRAKAFFAQCAELSTLCVLARLVQIFIKLHSSSAALITHIAGMY